MALCVDRISPARTDHTERELIACLSLRGVTLFSTDELDCRCAFGFGGVEKKEGHTQCDSLPPSAAGEHTEHTVNCHTLSIPEQNTQRV